MLVAASRCCAIEDVHRCDRVVARCEWMGQPRTEDTLLGIQSAIERVMQSLAGWIDWHCIQYSLGTVKVESPAIDKTRTATASWRCGPGN